MIYKVKFIRVLFSNIIVSIIVIPLVYTIRGLNIVNTPTGLLLLSPLFISALLLLSYLERRTEKVKIDDNGVMLLSFRDVFINWNIIYKINRFYLRPGLKYYKVDIGKLRRKFIPLFVDNKKEMLEEILEKCPEDNPLYKAAKKELESL